MPAFSRTERAALADLLLEVGPDAPTLCAGWDAHRLAVHLVARESRPDVTAAAFAAGVVRPLRTYRRRVLRRLAALPYPALVRRLKSGPPWWSPFGMPGAEPALNAVEFYVHHEDVRRAADGWEPRALGHAAEAELWRRLRRIRPFLLRDARGWVRLAAPGHGTAGPARQADGSVVTVTGAPSELVLYCYGRRAQARIDLDGAPAAVEALRRARLAV